MQAKRGLKWFHYEIIPDGLLEYGQALLQRFLAYDVPVRFTPMMIADVKTISIEYQASERQEAQGIAQQIALEVSVPFTPHPLKFSCPGGWKHLPSEQCRANWPLEDHFKPAEQLLYPPTVFTYNYEGPEGRPAKEVPYDCYHDALKQYNVGDVIRSYTAAPGYGYREHRITRMDATGVYAVLIRDRSGILTEAMVR